jgi:DNA-binding NarL/FixJ family response regulator
MPLMRYSANTFATIYRKLLENEADLDVVGEAKTGLQAVAVVKKLRPALVLMEMVMPLLNGLEATRQILKAVPGTKVLVLSMHSDDVCVEEAIKSGAMGYLVKYAAADIVCSAIREVQKGNMYFSPTIPSRLYKRSWKKQPDRIKLANMRNTTR